MLITERIEWQRTKETRSKVRGRHALTIDILDNLSRAMMTSFTAVWDDAYDHVYMSYFEIHANAVSRIRGTRRLRCLAGAYEDE